MSQNYREQLADAVNNLIEAEQILFTSALNVAWFGELSHLKDAYEVGDIKEFDEKLLQSISDLNVRKIVALLKPLQEAAEYLKNVNNLTDEELGWSENNQ